MTIPAATRKKLESIARKHLDIRTLETRKSDRLDFHEVSVWSLLDALTAAYDAGKADGSSAATGSMIDAMREQLSPEAFVTIAACLQIARPNDPEVGRQVRWFADLLIETVGTGTYNRTLDELGL